MRFSGFTAIYEEGRDDEQEKLDSPLPDLNEGEALTPTQYDPQQHFTQPPARYTEAMLVRAMEEKGVAVLRPTRPSSRPFRTANTSQRRTSAWPRHRSARWSTG